jgi:hypothetical protein
MERLTNERDLNMLNEMHTASTENQGKPEQHTTTILYRYEGTGTRYDLSSVQWTTHLGI